MIHGLDTGIIVAVEHSEHADHGAARQTLARLLRAGDRLALAPQVVAEFMHVVTDSRRFVRPIDMTTTIQLANAWWTANEVSRLFPDAVATQQFLT